MKLVKLRIIDTLDENGDIVEAIQLTPKWVKPLNELSYTFDTYIQDVNTGIIHALWSHDPLLSEETNKWFQVSELDRFLQNQLTEFLTENHMNVMNSNVAFIETKDDLVYLVNDIAIYEEDYEI